MVRAVVKKYGIDSGTVICDRLSDIDAASYYNLMAIGYRFDFAQEDELAGADFVIEDLLELKRLLSL